jgi:hypothetical protein
MKHINELDTMPQMYLEPESSKRYRVLNGVVETSLVVWPFGVEMMYV